MKNISIVQEKAYEKIKHLAMILQVDIYFQFENIKNTIYSKKIWVTSSLTLSSLIILIKLPTVKWVNL